MLRFMILLGISVIQSGAVKQDAGVRSATIGENVTLRCFYNGQSAMHFSWYRQTLGGRPQLLSSIYKYSDPSKTFHRLEEDPRFSVQIQEGLNHLHISDVHLSDAATYYCGSSHSNMVEFGEGLFLSVQGTETTQDPVSEPIQPGSSGTFSCTVQSKTCDEGLVVHWFRHGSHQGVLHTQKNHCQSISAEPSSSQSCVFHLQKEDLGSSDAGTYYCAVASCGRMLSRSGNKLLIRQDAEDQVVQIKIFFWLSVIRSGIIVLCVTICLLVFFRKSK